MSDRTERFGPAAAAAAGYRDSLAERPVPAMATADEVRRMMGGPLPSGPTPVAEVLDLLLGGGPGGHGHGRPALLRVRHRGCARRRHRG